MCDIWSCGVLLYILLTGEPPFSGDTDDIIMERIKIGKVTFESECIFLIKIIFVNLFQYIY